MGPFFLELDGNRDVRLRFTPEVVGDELRLTLSGGVATGVFTEEARVSYAAGEIPDAEREVLAARASLPADPAIALLRFVPRDGSIEFTAPGGENPFVFYGEHVRRILDNPHARFPLVLVAKVTIPANPGTPEPFRALYYLVRYEASHAARAEAHDALDLKGTDFGWLDWDAWTKGTLTARPWAQMSDSERLLAIADHRQREDTIIAAPMTPHFASFGERAPDAEAAGATCTYCGAVGRELYRVAPASGGDAALTPGAAAHDRISRLMCDGCRAANSGRQLDGGRRAALEKLRAAWHDGRLVSGSFSGDLHALSVIVGGKDGYFTIAERQAKELVDLLTFGEVLDLTAEKGVSDQGVDALFFANRGLFTPSGRRYIAVEVKSTSSVATLAAQIDQAIAPALNVAAKALLESKTRVSLEKSPAAIQAEVNEAGAAKRWYRYYVTRFAYVELQARNAAALNEGTALAPEVLEAYDRLARYFETPEGTSGADHARWSADTLARTVESVLLVRFTSLDGASDNTDAESIPTDSLAKAREKTEEYFDSYLYFDLFGRPLPGFVDTTIAGVDMGPVVALLDTVVRLLTRLRVRVHAQGHPEHYPREAVARLEAEAA